MTKKEKQLRSAWRKSLPEDVRKKILDMDYAMRVYGRENLDWSTRAKHCLTLEHLAKELRTYAEFDGPSASSAGEIEGE